MSKSHRMILGAVLALSVVLRVGAAFYLGDDVVNMPGTADQLSYHTLAQRVLGGYGFTFGEPWWPATAANEPTAHWSFLYTGFLALVYTLVGPNPLAGRLIQAILVGILHPLLVYWIGRRLFGTAAGLLAAAITAVYAYFIYYTANLMTESFYITAILASFILLFELTGWGEGKVISWRRMMALGFGLGLTLGAAVLLRQLFLLVIPFMYLWAAVGGRRPVAALGVATVVMVALILPFTAYNYARFGRFVLLNTNAGYAFFWGNHPIYGTKFESILPPEMGSYADLIPKELMGLDEASLDQELLKRGIGFIVDDPGRYILLSISRIPAYFMFWPSNESGKLSNLARVASFGVFWPVMLYGLIISFMRGSGKIRWRPASPIVLIYLFILVYTGIHLLTWALIRYRLPVDAFLILFAGLAVVDLAERVPGLRRWLKPAGPEQARS